MNLAELIKHYENESLPNPAYTTLCVLRRFAPVENCRYAVQYGGVTEAAFKRVRFAEQFARLARRDTPNDLPFEIVDLETGTVLLKLENPLDHDRVA